jgi:hypothetical protein
MNRIMANLLGDFLKRACCEAGGEGILASILLGWVLGGEGTDGMDGMGEHGRTRMNQWEEWDSQYL